MYQRNALSDSDEQRLQELFDYFQQKHSQRFWGTIQVKLKAGKPFLIEEHQQIKLGETHEG